MKIKQKTIQKKNVVLITVVTILIAASLITFFVFAQNNNLFAPSDSQDSSVKDKSSNKSVDETIKSNKTTTPPNTDHATPPATDESTGKKIIPVVVSATVDGSVVYIRGGLNVLETDGSCYAELTSPTGTIIKKDTTLLPNAGTTDCKTISIPTSELSAGEWTVTLNYASTNAEGKSSAASFTIQ